MNRKRSIDNTRRDSSDDEKSGGTPGYSLLLYYCWRAMVFGLLAKGLARLVFWLLLVRALFSLSSVHLAVVILCPCNHQTRHIACFGLEKHCQERASTGNGQQADNGRWSMGTQRVSISDEGEENDSRLRYANLG